MNTGGRDTVGRAAAVLQRAPTLVMLAWEEKRTGRQDHADNSFEAIIRAAMQHISYQKNTLTQRVVPHTQTLHGASTLTRFAEAVRQPSLAVIVLLPIGIWSDDGLNTARNNKMSPMLQGNQFSD